MARGSKFFFEPGQFKPEPLPMTGKAPKPTTLPNRGQTVQPQNLGGQQTLGSFAVDLINALGGKPSKQSRDLFNAWQRWEGGWSNNAAAYNPLNLTAPGSGYRTINSVGVVAMPNYQTGVKRTADLLRSGYPSLARAFQTGQVNFQDPAVQADLNRWLTGKRTPGMTPYVSKIARSYGASVPAGTTPSTPGAVPQPASPQSPQAPQYKTVWDAVAYRNAVRNQFLQGGRIDLMSLPGMVQSAYRQVQVPAVVDQHSRKAQTGGDSHEHTGGEVGAVTANGKVMNLPFSYKSTHATSGLEDEGFTRAVDIMAAPGTSVRSPGAGTIKYFHPTGAQGGGSMMIVFDNGRVGWLGHIANGLPAGTKIKAGQEIALISSDHRAPHAHWSVR